MNRLARIAQSATPATSVLFRKNAYGRAGMEEFLRDVLALANAAVDGPRYIITGAEFDGKGHKRLFSVDSEDFTGKPAYQSLANDHIEPPLKLNYQPVTIEGERVGVYEIGDCQDRPYMMRIDFSETLRRGDAYARVNNSAVKLGRRQLQTLFEKKFRDSISAANIEVGFPGSIIHKDHKIETCSLAKLPSAIASAKLQELIDAKERVQTTVANTAVARLTHARLFGSDSPYEERSTDEIIAEMQQMELQHRDQDEQFLFSQRHRELQIVVLNQGEEPLHDASLKLVMPRNDAFHVAVRLPKVLKNGEFFSRTPAEQADYPAVTLRDDSVQISAKLDDIEPGEPAEVFGVPLRICIDAALKGRRIGIQYTLFAQNLRTPAKGKLRLLLK
jgi:hypothetical protein